MVEKKVFVLTLFVFVLVFGMLNFFSVYYLNTPLSPVALTGQVVENGIVRLYIEGGDKIVTIHYPLNITYDNDSYTCSTPSENPKCGDYRYLLELNVSADFFVDDWNYSLYDLRHSEYTAAELDLTPNVTMISATRWGNRLTVGAHEEDGDWISEEVVFYIEVPNSEPVFGDIDSEIFVCEGKKIAYPFSASDVDEEDLIGSIFPSYGLFYLNDFGMSDLYTSWFRIVSNPLTTTRMEVPNGFISKTYAENISVDDRSGGVDGINTVSVDIIVIEVNSPIVLKNIDSYTVYFSGEGTSFDYQADVVAGDEDGDSADGNLYFNLSFYEGGENVFDINSSTGVMNYTANETHNGSVFYLRVCVSDNGLNESHSNFAFCADQDFTNESTSDCKSFTLTVTDVNRAPVIDSYSPSDDNFSVAGTVTSVFSVNVSDADGGNLSVDWYVDGVLKEDNDVESYDDFSYSFGCGVRGEREVSVVVSDGLVNVSQVWNVSVSIVACPVGSSGGGSSGGGGGTLGGYCVETWACGDWNVCQNVERSFVAKSLSPEDYYSTKEICVQNQFDDRFCGLQLAECLDLSVCNNSEYKVPRPSESRVCYFTEDPSCSDGITNCHDGGCELLVDCGGPCPTCPTCSDGKQNQGEGDVDCGGPCPFRCDAESPFGAISYALIGLVIILIVAVLFIAIKLFNIWRYGVFVKKRKRKR